MNESIVDRLKYWGNIVIYIFVILELVLFPSLPNFAGCVMTVICWTIFRSIGLRESTIREHPFTWLVFLSMSLYRILPIIATLLEYKPISYKFELPYETFFYETLLYTISSVAFYLAIKKRRGNNIIQKLLYKMQFYQVPKDKTLWMFGTIGLVAKITMLATGHESIISKLMAGFSFLQVAPILLFFPFLYKKSDVIIRRHTPAMCFSIFLVLLSLAANSRQSMLLPIGTFVLLFLLALIKSRVDYRKYINFKSSMGFIVVAVMLLPAISDISTAMILTRGIRSDVSRSELFNETWKLFNDKQQLHKLEDIAKQATNRYVGNYQEGWTEEYVDNFVLNRYCNIRITDVTLYHANKIGFSNPIMQKKLYEEILKLLPSPILSFFGINLDKTSNEQYSRGDILYGLSIGNYLFGKRVTSHVADGLATFGYWYFIIQFILFYLQFIVLNWFVYNKNGQVIYSTLALISIFTFLAMFRNAGGCFGEIGFLIRGFIQIVTIYLVTYNILKRI